MAILTPSQGEYSIHLGYNDAEIPITKALSILEMLQMILTRAQHYGGESLSETCRHILQVQSDTESATVK